jgi:hypothetical protein
MNIGFYGHSNCAYRGNGSFIDIIAERFKAKIVNTGVKQGSEERILFELKKTKSIDLAIIFHSPPRYLFIPETDRDIDTNSFKFKRAEEIFKDDHLDVDFTEKHSQLFKNKFENNENLFAAVDVYRKYFHHPDLSMNRFYGALIQIDQYISEKSISTIHVVDKNAIPIPSWFSFKHGIVDYSVAEIIKQNPAKNNFFYNCITEEANALIAEKLINIIAVRGREDIRLRETQETEVRIPRPLQ